jgi:hypothetical protein
MNTVPTVTPEHTTSVPFRHTFHPTRTVLAFALLGGAAVLARHHGINLWVLAVGVIGPDLSFLAAIGAPDSGTGTLPRRAVRPYNLVHHPAGPLLLTAIGVTLTAPLATVVGLAWLSHQAWDRGLGYQLRNSDGTIRRETR